MIAIVDYGVGNLASIQNMLKKIGGPAVRIDGNNPRLFANCIEHLNNDNELL